MKPRSAKANADTMSLYEYAQFRKALQQEKVRKTARAPWYRFGW